ncbi:MAG: FHA domain-containing protein [Ruminiclostridium sp.]|nr:FHA domain-containing protein [Ruminiclostridium sp.]
MLKKLLLFLTAAAIMLPFAHASAEDKKYMETETYYCSGNNVNVIAKLPDGAEYGSSNITAYLTAPGSNQIFEGEKAEPLKVSANETVDYILLVECSEKMAKYREDVADFARKLIKNSENAELTLMCFGEDFSVAASGLKNADDAETAASELVYDDKYSDICGGVTYALKEAAKNASSERMTQLIVLTAGVARVRAGSDTEAVKIKTERADEAKKAIAASPDVIVHTVGGFGGDWGLNPTTYKSVSSGSGLDIVINQNVNVNSAAAKICAYTDSLYRFSFAFNELAVGDDESFNMRIYYCLNGVGQASGNNNIICSNDELENIKNIDLPRFDDGSDETGVALVDNGDPTDADVPGGNPDDGENPGDNPDDGEKPGDNPDDGEKPGDNPDDGENPGDDPGDGENPGENADGSENPGDGDNPDTDDPNGGEDGKPSEGSAASGNEGAGSETTTAPAEPPLLNIIIITAAIGGGVIVLAIIIAVIIGAARKKKQRSFQPTANGYPAGAAAPVYNSAPRPVRIQFMSGRLPDASVMLGEQIIIGSGRNCDVICRDATVTSHNVRLSMVQGEIYIEDLNAQPNTMLGGVRLSQPAALRSGDEITMGRVRFRIYF